MYEEDGTTFSESLYEAKEIRRETRNFKSMPLWRESLTPKYRESQLIDAKNVLNEYRRLKKIANEVA